MTPRLLIHPNPATGLEAKFSMPFCAAAALVYPRVGIDTFDVTQIRDPRVQALLPRVTLRANESFDAAPALAGARDGVVCATAASGRRPSMAHAGIRDDSPTRSWRRSSPTAPVAR